MSRPPRTDYFAPLTLGPAEKKVMLALVEAGGKPARAADLAERLGTTPQNVRSRITTIRNKFGKDAVLTTVGSGSNTAAYLLNPDVMKAVES